MSAEHDPTPDPESDAIHNELREVELAKRRGRVMDLRHRRVTFRDMVPIIRDEFPHLGCSVGTLHTDYKRAMAELGGIETAEEMRREDLDTVERLVGAWLPLATGLPVLDEFLLDGEAGVERFVKVLAQSAKAAEVVLKALARRARLAGLDHVGMDESGRFDPATADVEQVVERVAQLHGLYANHAERTGQGA